MIFLLYLAVGAFVGTLSGLFGIGGGVIIVPTLLLIFKEQGFSSDITMFMALGTSLATIVVTAASSTLRHYNMGNLIVEVSKKLIPPILVGICVGAYLVNQVKASTLEALFITYLYLVSLKMILYKVKVDEPKETSKFLYGITGFIIGLKSSILGIGGGTISVPFLTWRGYPMKNAVGTSASIGIPIALTGSAFYIYNGFDKLTPEYSLGYVYLPAFFGISIASFFFTKLGAKISSVANQVLMKKIFAIMLILIAIKKTTSFIS
ncbi:sulfite exporter TauE/SafE family protein [Halobacteriovorax vibrionivorans]|uniref:Probable membrane transporter protein n=1 Tax=Halobacteriovorax vibrionivorans TaxID=2152716 RepID=A0ABY0IHJ5_9BACT|nr:MULTISPECIES: sulfite exporter TauE/SafE family protein [Halobacteriovorax]RZF22421.1 sulfite exporter TauE/SafE family protein [Halobacteriovorax vibrionivorans]TGD47612.1 sulfite exporter TauE/SafE family protein [Halobacteriovorax sp. Y22]